MRTRLAPESPLASMSAARLNQSYTLPLGAPCAVTRLWCHAAAALCRATDVACHDLGARRGSGPRLPEATLEPAHDLDDIPVVPCQQAPPSDRRPRHAFEGIDAHPTRRSSLTRWPVDDDAEGDRLIATRELDFGDPGQAPAQTHLAERCILVRGDLACR